MKASTSQLVSALTSLAVATTTDEFCAGTVYQSVCCQGYLTGSSAATGSSFSLAPVPTGTMTAEASYASSLSIHHPIPVIPKTGSEASAAVSSLILQYSIHASSDPPTEVVSKRQVAGPGGKISTVSLGQGITCVGAITSFPTATSKASETSTSAGASSTKSSGGAATTSSATGSEASAESTPAATSSAASTAATGGAGHAAGSETGLLGLVGAGMGLMMGLL